METKQIPDVLAKSSSLRVIEIDPQNDPRWQALITDISTSSLFYHPAWLQLQEEAFGYKPAHLACEDANGQLIGILPLFYQRGLHSGRVLRSVFTGPLVYDDQATAALMRGAIERARAEPGTQLHLKVMSNAFDNQVEGVVGVPLYETYVLALPERAELLRLDPPIKRAISKAIKSGVEVRPAETERELRAWYELYLQTMRKLTAIPLPYHFFELQWRRLHSKGLLRLLLAEHIEAGRKKLLAGFLFPTWGKTVSYATAGWREEDQALRPNDILHWRAIQDACTEGLRWYDLGDVDLDNHGLARYKSKWGAEAKLVYNYGYPRSSGAGNGGANNLSENRIRQFVQATWKRLPTKALGLIGDCYYALHLY